MAGFSKSFPVFETETAVSASVRLPAVCLIILKCFFNASHCYYFFFLEGVLFVDDSLFKYCFFLFDLASFLQLSSGILTHWIWLESRSCLSQFSFHVLSFVRAILYLIYLLPGWWLHIQSVCQVLLRQPFQSR